MKRRRKIKKITKKHAKTYSYERWIKTGIDGLDALFKHGMPKGSIVLVVGGPGSGKTIFCLQMLYQAAKNGEKCLYMSFEEDPEKLREHMKDFGWNPEEYEKKGLIRIKKYDPLKMSKQVEALLEKAEGDLRIDIPPLFVEDNFKPERVFVDSLSAISAAFIGEESYYRIYIEQFFEQLRAAGVTAFLIAEYQDFSKQLTKSGVEEFLADGVIILHTFRKGGYKERGIEVYKMRGCEFKEKIVAMQIVSGKGIVVYPEQEVLAI